MYTAKINYNNDKHKKYSLNFEQCNRDSFNPSVSPNFNLFVQLLL